MFTATGAVDWNPGDKFTNGDEKQPRSVYSGEAQDSRQDRPQTRQDEGSQQAREAAVGGPARPPRAGAVGTSSDGAQAGASGVAGASCLWNGALGPGVKFRKLARWRA